MKTLPFILIALAMLSLAGCNGTTVYAAGAATGIFLTRDKDKPPADTASQIPEHESWCYSTLGYPQCYPYPINTHPSRLINVEPQNRYPLTPAQYWEAVYAAR
ncbi:MAG: hypothetical protein AB7H77_08640 [Bdellovibrionales bacterium]